MVDYEKCMNCDCFDHDYGQSISSDACILCEMTEEELEEMAEWYSKNYERLKGLQNEIND